MSKINFYNVDCLEFMADVPDNFYELAIVDPPYGIGERLVKGGKGHGFDSLILSNADRWDKIPEKTYFDELFRVSKNQIIWGGNFFELPSTKQPLCWDKVRPNQKNVSEWEMAWTSFEGRSRLYKYCANGGFVAKEKRIHPTQKPTDLYRWTLQNFATPGWKILDTHGGSMSSAIACDMEGFDLDICEIDKDYFNAGKQRFFEYKRQLKLF